VQGARSVNMGNQTGADSKIHHARLIVVPTQRSSWGYGLYLRPDLPVQIGERATAQFAALKQPALSLARALDVGAAFRFVVPKATDIDAMRAALDMAP
jgi:hypothetical protein